MSAETVVSDVVAVSVDCFLVEHFGKIEYFVVVVGMAVYRLPWPDEKVKEGVQLYFAEN